MRGELALRLLLQIQEFLGFKAQMSTLFISKLGEPSASTLNHLLRLSNVPLIAPVWLAKSG